MKAPICMEDIKHGHLCRICEAKLKAGQISELDVALLKAVSKLENRKFLISTEIVRAFELSDIILVFAKGNVGALIGREGKNIKELEKALGKTVRVVALSKKPRDTIQQVFGRINVLAVNKVFKPWEGGGDGRRGGGGEELKAIVENRGREKLEADRQKLEEILGKVLKTHIKIEFS